MAVTDRMHRAKLFLECPESSVQLSSRNSCPVLDFPQLLTVRYPERKRWLLLTDFFWRHQQSKEDDDPTSKLHSRGHQKGILEEEREG